MRDLSELNYIIKAEDGCQYYVNFLQIEMYKEPVLKFEESTEEELADVSVSVLDWTRTDILIQVCAACALLLAVIGLCLGISDYMDMLRYVGQGAFSILGKLGLRASTTSVVEIAYHRSVLSQYLSTVIFYAFGLIGAVSTCILSHKRKNEKMKYIFSK